MLLKSHVLLGLSLAIGLLGTAFSASSHENEDSTRFIQVSAKTKEERTKLQTLGLSIEFTRSDSVWGFASPSVITDLSKSGATILGNFDMAVGRGGHEILDFPEKDKRFHNYAELTAELNGIQNRNRSLVKIVSIGKSLEGRDIWAIHINTDQESLKSNQSTKPGIIYLGAHHAREHLSAEIPLMFADYILAQSTDTKIEALLENRDIWIIPMVNPDGAEYDIASGSYKMWRKNRRKNKDSTYGVDLNRNYGYMWGGEGASDNPTSDVYRGPEAFSEPETQAVRDWIESHANLKTLLSLHTFSELILYPWGYTYDAITNQKDAQTFEKMAKTMATWNQYKPQQSSDLYITSGDTTDWAYGKHGIFAFTFELSPSSLGGGGFYPGAGVIDKVFEANIKPLLYLLDLTDDPYRALTAGPTGFLPHYVAPEVDPALHWGGSF